MMATSGKSTAARKTAKRTPAKKAAPKAVSKSAKSANKTTATKASVPGYVAALDNANRRAEAESLVKIFDKATGWRAQMWGPTIIGFGRYAYTYDSGRKGEMCVLGFSPRKAAISLYLHTGSRSAQELLTRLGKIKKEVGCIYVNKLADIDLAVLEKLIKVSKSDATQAFKDKGWPVSAT